MAKPPILLTGAIGGVDAPPVAERRSKGFPVRAIASTEDGRRARLAALSAHRGVYLSPFRPHLFSTRPELSGHWETARTVPITPRVNGEQFAAAPRT